MKIGALTGYDVAEEEWKEFAVFNPKDSWNTAFKVAFGQRKSPRAGEKEGRAFHQDVHWKQNAEHSQQMRVNKRFCFFNHPFHSFNILFLKGIL